MVLALVVGGITCLAMIAGILFFPQIKIKNLKIDSYWVIALIGALVLIFTGGVDFKYLCQEMVKDTSINPIKILVLFITMTILSIFLDEVGFFSYLASKTLILAKNSQMKLFVWLYVIVSVLTVFTSNDIIVLTFTPFICYFAKNAKIKALPYLITEFVAANTMSMTFIIGNPTNIYVATTYGVGFVEYLQTMFLPTLASALVSFGVLFLLFRKELNKPAEGTCEVVPIKNKTFLTIGLIHLIVCTIALAIGPYFGLDMWIVALVSAISLIVIILAISLFKKETPVEIGKTLARAPWQLVPFVLSMFTIILSLQSVGITEAVSSFLGTEHVVFKYGALSYLASNVINNIPMSVFFCSVISPLSGTAQLQAIYATVVGSNLGAIFTPIGALAGIMWSSMLKEHGEKLSYLGFVKYGAAVSIPSLAINLLILTLLV